MHGHSCFLVLVEELVHVDRLDGAPALDGVQKFLHDVGSQGEEGDEDCDEPPLHHPRHLEHQRFSGASSLDDEDVLGQARVEDVLERLPLPRTEAVDGPHRPRRGGDVPIHHRWIKLGAAARAATKRGSIAALHHALG